MVNHRLLLSDADQVIGEDEKVKYNYQFVDNSFDLVVSIHR